MSLEIAWKQNILVTAFHLLKSLLVVFGFGSPAFVCRFSRQNINSVVAAETIEGGKLFKGGNYIFAEIRYVEPCPLSDLKIFDSFSYIVV